MKRRYASLTIFAVALLPGLVLAKVRAPPAVVVDRIQFSSHDNYVEARHTKSNQLRWKRIVYPSIEPEQYDPNIEKDMQWNVIVSLEVVTVKVRKHLKVRNSKGQVFCLELTDGQPISCK
jgi:hypothetical protein